MNAIVSNLSDAALEGTPHYKLNVLFPLWLSLYKKEVYIKHCANFAINESDTVAFKQVLVTKNMVTHLAASTEEQFELQQAFNLLLELKDLSKYKLRAVADTLFYTSLHFLAVYWAESTDQIKDRSKQNRNHYYAGSTQSSRTNIKELSKLFLAYNNSQNKHCVTDISISINGIPFPISGEQLRTWIIDSLETNIIAGSAPLGALGEEMYLLQQVLKKKYAPVVAGQTDMLVDLQLLSSQSNHKYIGEEYRIIKSFCNAIHPIFSHVMNEDRSKFTNAQLRLYVRILKVLRIIDLTYGHPSAGKLADRLRSILKQA
ncbi:hypothetical protein SAMN06265348_110259 [Pedobacter westerhofensis]|uniref:Uncharacterized protein n=1 Tax=Pedobacter westerhofensis TaxID=425512 RepID=A0A521F7D4_9SPHI|nr:hypothetical protein [Pedobacter westerhofensis]SMO92073.1 hypothetical protein SAMN06265348_110259 [Pedobacter westerhofensis]